MKDLVNEIITSYYSKGHKVEVIKRYLQMRYHINIDLEALRNRIEKKKLSFT